MHDYHDHHSHGHTHGHGHVHDHSHSGTAAGEQEEVKALLGYMLSHNEHHAEELIGISDRLRDLDMEVAAEIMDQAISHYNNGNALVEKALLAMGE